MKTPSPVTRDKIIERLKALYTYLDDEEGLHVKANTVALAIEELEREREAPKAAKATGASQ